MLAETWQRLSRRVWRQAMHKHTELSLLPLSQGSNANDTLGTLEVPKGSYSTAPVPLSGGGAWTVVQTGPTNACGGQVEGSGAQAAVACS